ncbi:MAG TPA: serine/threonine-protein kinase [Polyangia bacterium]
MSDLPLRFGPYLLERRLAVGGMGELFIARRVAPEGPNGGVAGRPCVLKRILPELSERPEFVARFHEEAALAVRLRHECILRVLEVGICDERHYLVLEHVDGPDLRRLLSACWRARRRLPVPVAIYIAHQLLGALAYAHDLRDRDGEPLGLIHRDVSPSNVLVARQGDVKLIDFGLAKTRAAAVSTRPNVLFGKVGYLSPEQARGYGVDQRSDIYSVGAILHELLTGERLVNAESAADLLELVAHPTGPAPVSSLRAGLPPELDRVVARALCPQASQRWASARELQVALAPFLGGMPLPELRATTGQAVVDLLGPTDRPAVAGDDPAAAPAAIEVEGSREPTERRARAPRARRRPDPGFRSGIDTVYGARPDGEYRVLPDVAVLPPEGAVTERPGLWRRLVLWMLGATLLMLIILQGLR